VKYAFVRAQDKEFAIKRMCQILQISRSGYYDWRVRQDSERSRRDRVLLQEIRRIHQQTKEAYGATKTWRALNQSGTVCAKHRVARLRRQAGIEARRKCKFRLATRLVTPRPHHPIFYAGLSKPTIPIRSG